MPQPLLERVLYRFWHPRFSRSTIVKPVIAIVVGYMLWTVVFLGSAAGIRAVMPDVYDEAGFSTDTTALMCHLVSSVVASLLAGVSVSVITRSKSWTAAMVLALCLLGTGIPVQLSAWDKLPVWYNLVFLVLLVPMTLLGAMLAMPKTGLAAEADAK